MQNLEISTVFFLVLGAVAGGLAIYYSFEIVREWLGQWIRATTGIIRRGIVPNSTFDAHIATQWTEGRLRLDALLALLQVLATSLEQEVETLRKLDHSSPLYEREAPLTMSRQPCVGSPSINICGMSASCWSPFCSSVPRTLRNFRAWT
jgi:hypothetical protein